MCTRFVYNGNDTITGFNFDIDLSVWTHKVIIGIKMPDNQYHSFHGINRNGNVGTLLYVNGNKNNITISDLTESYIKGEISFDDTLKIVQKQKIIYAKDISMQAMLSDKNGRVLIIEPGIGYRLEQAKYSLITNYSILNPEVIRPFIVSGDDRYERAKKQLEQQDDDFSVTDAFGILKSVRQEGLWATRVTFVYSFKENKVYYALNNDFENIKEYQFDTVHKINHILPHVM